MKKPSVSTHKVIQWLLLAIAHTVLTGMTTGCVQAAPANRVIEYHRTGGFAGTDDRLVISADNQVKLTRQSGSTVFTLDPQIIAQLQQQLDQAEFSQLNNEYLPANTCCDLVEYTINYKGHTVRTMDTAIPDALYPAMELLDRIIENGGNP